jgi:hypothetical protein
MSLSWRAVACLVAALLLAQWLGLAHGIAHADHAAHRHHHAHGAAPGGPAPIAFSEPLAPTHWLGGQGLFDDHEDESQCRLYDQLSHADLIASWLALPIPSALPQRALPSHGAWHLAAQATGFLARGPPARG